MKKYIVNIIFSGNLRIPMEAKNVEDAEEKAFEKCEFDSIDFIKLFKRYGQLIDFEMTDIEEIPL